MSVTTPPKEPDIHAKTLSPVSPKPLHYPSPANIPILEKQMEPDFHDSLAHQFPQTQNQSLVQEHQALPLPHPSAEGIQSQVTNVDMAASALSSGDGAPRASTESSSNHPSSSIPATAQWSHILGNPTAEAPSASFPAVPISPSLPSEAVLTHDAPVPSQEPKSGDQAAAGITNSQVPGGDTVDFDALLANLSKSPTNTFANAAGFQQLDSNASPSQPGAGGAGGPAASFNSHNLPPRPPPQDKPSIHPNYAPSDDLRAYHPHSQYSAPSGPPNVMNSGNGMHSQPAPTLPQPQGSTTFTSQSPSTPTFPQHSSAEPRFNGGEPWDMETQRKYDEFLTNERLYDQDRNWAKFPEGSRLFVGNLPTELVTKRDLFLRFHKYGLIVQISIKKAFGFVQFLDQEACRRALAGEQSNVIQGRKINLEISRPQQDRNQQSGGRDSRRRSRSPPRSRGQQGQGGFDRYRDRPVSPRSRDRHYRPGRSPSPRGYRVGRRDRSPGRDRYDGRRRSRSPMGRYMSGGSPRRVEDDDGVPWPRRHPAQIPDVQIVLLENLERNFVALIESQFMQRGLRTEILHLPPGIPQDSVIRRQAVEGVIAVVTIGREAMSTYSIPVMLFDRAQGFGNVKFELYEHVKPDDAPQLVIRHKQAQQQATATVGVQPQPWSNAPPYQQYGYPPAPDVRRFDAAPPQPVPPAAAVPGNVDLNSLLNTINSNPELQRLVAQSQQKQQPGFPPQQQVSATAQTDLANLLRTVQQPQAGTQQTHAYGQPQPSPATPSGQQNPLAALSALLSSVGGNPTSITVTAPAPQQQPAQHQQSGQPDMAELMAQLAQYNGRK